MIFVIVVGVFVPIYSITDRRSPHALLYVAVSCLAIVSKPVLYPDLHEAALKLLAHKFARLKTSEELIQELASF